MNQKRCSKCGEVKDLSEFYGRSNRPAGLAYECKECCKTYAPKRYARNREAGLCQCGRPRTEGHKTCAGCLAAIRKCNKRRRAEFKKAGLCIQCGKTPTGGFHYCEKCSAARGTNGIKVLYHEREILFQKQNGLCPICERPLLGFIRKVHSVIDHDHETGAIRGLLHNKCNLTVNNLDLATARRIVGYLSGPAPD